MARRVDPAGLEVVVGLHVKGWLPAAEAKAPLGGSAVPIRACRRGREAKVGKVVICAPPLLEHLCYRTAEALGRPAAGSRHKPSALSCKLTAGAIMCDTTHRVFVFSCQFSVGGDCRGADAE